MTLLDWLPITKKETDLRGWDEVDIVFITGDAYVDHPAFGAAVIGRVLEHNGFRVALIPQPNWRDDLRDFKKFGKPMLYFGVSAGCMDSMVNKYTANGEKNPGSHIAKRVSYICKNCDTRKFGTSVT